MNLDSLPRLLDFISCFSTEEFTVDGVLYKPPKKLVISNCFFRSYTCPPNCGGCCKSVSLLYFDHNISDFLKQYPELKSDISARIITVNNQRKSCYVLKNGDAKQCRFNRPEDGRCLIHKAHPLLCRFELKKFIHRKDKTFFTKRLPGRGWLFNAQCKMTPFEREAFEQDISELREVEEIAKTFGIKNKIAQVIEELQLRGGNTKWNLW